MVVFGIDWLINWLSDYVVQHIKLTVAILNEEQQFVSFLFLSLSLCYDIYQISVKMRGSTQRSLALENSRRFAAPRRVSRRDFGCLFFESIRSLTLVFWLLFLLQLLAMSIPGGAVISQVRQTHILVNISGSYIWCLDSSRPWGS